MDVTDEPAAPSGRVVTVAIVLAAGAGSRFAGGQHKLTAIVGGRPMAEHAIRAAVDAAIGPVIVVTGASDLDDLDPGLLAQVTRCHNPDWADGQSTSIATGIDVAIERSGAGAVVVGLADQPGITADAWHRVAASDAPMAIATYDGARRNPVRLDRSVWELLPTEGDIGARNVARLRPDLVEEVPCPGSPVDIDTLEDLRTWQNRSSTNSP